MTQRLYLHIPCGVDLNIIKIAKLETKQTPQQQTESRLNIDPAIGLTSKLTGASIGSEKQPELALALKVKQYQRSNDRRSAGRAPRTRECKILSLCYNLALMER